MASLWDVVTSNSTLPIGAANTFFDHLNNQNSGSGSGTVIIGGDRQANIKQSISSTIQQVELRIDKVMTLSASIGKQL